MITGTLEKISFVIYIAVIYVNVVKTQKKLTRIHKKSFFGKYWFKKTGSIAKCYWNKLKQLFVFFASTITKMSKYNGYP